MFKSFNKEKFRKALEQLFSTITVGEYAYPNTRERRIAIKYIRSVSSKHFTKKEYKIILKYLQNSDAFLSADFLEDDYGFDFEAMNTDFTVNYKGGYTFVEDKWLPKMLTKERKNFKKLLDFYIGETLENKKLKKRYKNIKMPLMDFYQDELYEMNFENVILYHSTFKKCNLDTMKFYKSNLEKVCFKSCIIENVQFIHSPLSYSKFLDCEIVDCDFHKNKITDIEFINCTFNRVVFLGWETMRNIDLVSCQFKQCHLSFSDLREQKSLTQEQLNNFLGDDDTLLPSHLTKPDFWPLQSDMYTWDHWVETGEVIESNASTDYE